MWDASAPDSALDPTRNRFLVVWTADRDEDTSASGEEEIYGRFVNATTGAAMGTEMRLTDFGPPDNAAYDAQSPRVVFNPLQDEFFVAFAGNTDGEREIYGTRVAADTGNAFPWIRLSDMGPEGSGAYIAQNPDLIYQADANEYVVVWTGTDNEGGHVSGEQEIFAQRVSGVTGTGTGANDIPVSEMGPVGNQAYDALTPAIAWDSHSHRSIVVWAASHDADGQLAGEREIFMQFLDPDTALPLASSPIRISLGGGVLGDDDDLDAADPAVAFSADDNEFLVVWRDEPFVSGEYVLTGQRINAEFGFEVGPDDAALVADVHQDRLTIAYNPVDENYLAGFSREIDLPGGTDLEIFLAAVTPETALEGPPSRISFMGESTPEDFSAEAAAVAVSPAGAPLFVWGGDHDQDGQVDSEFEVFGSLFTAEIFEDGFESGDTSAWSSVID